MSSLFTSISKGLGNVVNVLGLAHQKCQIVTNFLGDIHECASQTVPVVQKLLLDISPDIDRIIVMTRLRVAELDLCIERYYEQVGQVGVLTGQVDESESGSGNPPLNGNNKSLATN